jgi:dolichol-phosphate mannosyltransferase
MISPVSLEKPALDLSAKPFADMTVIVPTLNERASIDPLFSLLAAHVPGASVIIADDNSSDGTPDAVRALIQRDDISDRLGNCLLLDRRVAAWRGLTASVLDGCRACRTEYLVVMDADLQHPPEILPELYRRLKDGADVVVACRESVGGKFSRFRELISRVATELARFRLRRAGIEVSDPLSGYFAVRTADISAAAEKAMNRFQPSGYKVLFDYLKLAPELHHITGKGLSTLPCASPRSFLRVDEVMFCFGKRLYGESKLGISHIVDFLRSLFK